MKSNKLYIAICIKIILMIFFSSAFNTELFKPFVSIFIQASFNPWQYYFENQLSLDAFPYHSLMLYILYPFSLLSDLVGVSLIFKLPLLLADILILYILLKLSPHREQQVYIFYFFNPIILYSIYIHAQLDIIPTALMLWSIYLLTHNRYIFSSIVTGFALATKFHIIVAIPLIVFYIYKTENINLAIKYILVSIFVFLVLDSPFLLSDGFIEMVLLNSKQSLLFDTYFKIGAVNILLPVATILMVYFHFFNQNKVNYDLLFFYFGLLFTATIFFIYPGPAWYVWMIPFVSIYFIRNKNQNKTLILYGVFSLTYLVFFIFFYKSEYVDILFMDNEINLKVDNPKLINIVFTVLEVVLLAIMYVFYKYGIKSNSIYKKKTNLTIGIGGDSGVGKTTLLNNLYNIVGEKLLQIEGDGEHKWERGDNNWKKFTHLDPKANHIHKQADAIYQLNIIILYLEVNMIIVQESLHLLKKYYLMS